MRRCLIALTFVLGLAPASSSGAFAQTSEQSNPARNASCLSPCFTRSFLSGTNRNRGRTS